MAAPPGTKPDSATGGTTTGRQALTANPQGGGQRPDSGPREMEVPAPQQEEPATTTTTTSVPSSLPIRRPQEAHADLGLVDHDPAGGEL